MEIPEENKKDTQGYQFLELTFVLPGILVSAILGVIFFLALPIIELWGAKTPNLALSILLILLGLGAVIFFVASPIYLLKKQSQWQRKDLGLTLLAILLANTLPIAIMAISVKSELSIELDSKTPTQTPNKDKK